MIIKCIAIDDEPLALEKINDFIQKIQFLKLEKTFNNAIDSIDFLKTDNIDLIFLDIQMDHLNGIQFLKNIKPNAKVIFTTAYEEHAIEGYELNVVDYLLKPYTFERFLKAVNKVTQMIDLQTEKKSNSSNLKSDFFFVKTEHKLKKIQVSEILYVKSISNYLQIVLKSEKVMTLMNFEQISNLLPPENFIRVHKSFIVAIDKIESIENNQIIIEKEYIPISTTFKSIFLEKINGFNAI